MKEIWKTVIYEGEIYENYEVSNCGRVRSLNYNRTGEVKELKPSVNSRGYLQVELWKGGKRKQCLVHRLVAFAFIPNDNPTEKTDINHINEIKTDCRVENLEWTTHKQNMNHGTRTERTSRKVRCVETGIVYDSTRDVKRKLGLAHSSICNCCKGKQKSCGGFHWEYVS